MESLGNATNVWPSSERLKDQKEDDDAEEPETRKKFLAKPTANWPCDEPTVRAAAAHVWPVDEKKNAAAPALTSDNTQTQRARTSEYATLRALPPILVVGENDALPHAPDAI